MLERMAMYILYVLSHATSAVDQVGNQANDTGEKRGCAAICPNGEMKTGKGKRCVLVRPHYRFHTIGLKDL